MSFAANLRFIGVTVDDVKTAVDASNQRLDVRRGVDDVVEVTLDMDIFFAVMAILNIIGAGGDIVADAVIGVATIGGLGLLPEQVKRVAEKVDLRCTVRRRWDGCPRAWNVVRRMADGTTRTELSSNDARAFARAFAEDNKDVFKAVDPKPESGACGKRRCDGDDDDKNRRVKPMC